MLATLDAEQWRDVPGYEGLYSVSDRGRVRRHPSRTLWRGRQGHYYRTLPARIAQPMRTTAGYFSVRLHRGGTTATRALHRVVYEAFAGPIQPGLEINHLDCDPTNNALANLELVTRKGNMEYCVRMGRMPRGEQRSNARLTDAGARTAYERVVLRGERTGRVAADLGVGHSTVSAITRGYTYRHLGLERVVFDSKGKPRKAVSPCP